MILPQIITIVTKILHVRKLNVLKRVWYTVEFSDIYMYHLSIVYMIMHVTTVPTCTRKFLKQNLAKCYTVTISKTLQTD